MLLILAFILNLASPRSIIVQIENISKIQGTLRICVCNQSEAFLRNCYSTKNVLVKDQKMEVTLTDVPESSFSISVYHHENDNQKLDSGLFKIPKEPYGFSNNPSTIFGPPSYEKCIVQPTDQKIKIRLK